MGRLILILTITVFGFFSCTTKQPVQQYQQKETKDALYYYKIGLSYLNSGDNSQAIYYLRKAYQIDPNNPDILIALGIAYTNVKEYQKAKQLLQKAIQIDPNKGEAYTNLGIILAKEKRFEEALKHLQKAVKIPSYTKKHIAYYNIALVYIELGNEHLAEEYLKKALLYNSNFLPAYTKLGQLYLSQGRYKEALAVFLKAKERGLTSPEVYIGLGEAYYHLKEYQKARSYLLKARQMATGKELLQLKIKRLLTKVDQKIKEEAQRRLAEQKRKEKELEKRREIEKMIEEKLATIEVSRAHRLERAEEVLGKLREEGKKQVERVKYTKPKIRFYVLLGKYYSKKSALKVVNKLKENGIEPKLIVNYINGRPVYTVIVGYFKGYREASKFYRKKIKPLGIRGLVKFTRK
ncbi:MAG: tetratricopeptide repeat protein [Aquificae bacterium]|nr:tetratricopeptide repeat protein [Aquificota bacterium]